MKKTAVLILLAFLLSLALLLGTRWGLTTYNQRQIGGDLTATVDPVTAVTGDFALTWDGDTVFVTHTSQPDKVLWQSVPGLSFVNAAQGQELVTDNRGSFTIHDRVTAVCADQTLDEMVETAVGVVLRGQLTCSGGQSTGYELTFFQIQPDHLRFVLKLDNPTFNRTYFTYASSADEHFLGFGEQFSYFDFKGKRLPIFVMEQGIGRGVQPVTALVNLVAGAGGDWTTTYAGVPHYLTSQMRSLFLETSEYSTFDMRQDDRVQVGLFSGEMNGRILNGDSPSTLIERYTEYAGRMRPLPDWIMDGAIIGMQGGTARVREVWAQLEAADVPISAFWLQDWVGQRTTSFGKQLWWNWQLDGDHYPNWAQLVDDLGAAGIRVLIYNNAFLADVSAKANAGRNLFREAADLGYLVQTETGDPYLIQNTDFNAGLVDLTNPAAREWLKGVILEEMVGIGASGWMADFGEAFPYDAVTMSGAAPATYHNRYPEEWAALNREVLDELPNGADMVFFSRAGYTRSPGISPLFWAGDQLVTWDEHDGLKTAVTALLTSGLSGFAYNHSDIGGYTALTSPVMNVFRDKELLLRWMEVNAFTAVFRTHEGNRPDDNVQIYSDGETLDQFARMARVYTALAFYRQELAQEAADTGLPLVRHPFIHYPDDANLYDLSYQEFMLGRDFLIAPALDPGVSEVTVYLPEGEWVHVWTGEVFNGRQTITVPAPIGQPGVFYRAGSAAGAQFMANLEAAGIR
ncbi:MAG: alpha-glucosidase [Chloroflexi bacterium]|nr:alpha-glucosidase [Chloroflexota bacterium]MBP7045464.1 alpha-glucosidase [Chloroflexota bacterium]